MAFKNKTVGGFTQPFVTRNLLEQQARIEKVPPVSPSTLLSTSDSLEPIGK